LDILPRGCSDGHGVHQADQQRAVENDQQRQHDEQRAASPVAFTLRASRAGSGWR
jgi:hypothetical protein